MRYCCGAAGWAPAVPTVQSATRIGRAIFLNIGIMGGHFRQMAEELPGTLVEEALRCEVRRGTSCGRARRAVLLLHAPAVWPLSLVSGRRFQEGDANVRERPDRRDGRWWFHR